MVRGNGDRGASATTAMLVSARLDRTPGRPRQSMSTIVDDDAKVPSSA